MPISTPRKHRNRNRLPLTFGAAVPPVTWIPTINAAHLRMTCSIPVVLQDLPIGIKVQGNPPTVITPVSPAVFDLTYAAAVVATNTVIVPANVPQVRGKSGGYLAAGQHTFP